MSYEQNEGWGHVVIIWCVEPSGTDTWRDKDATSWRRRNVILIVGFGPKPTIRILRLPSVKFLIVGLGPKPTIRILRLPSADFLVVGLGPKPTIQISPLGAR